MKRTVFLIAIAALLSGCVVPYGASMLAPGYPHVGYYKNIAPPRMATWFDETGSPQWVVAEQAAHDHWLDDIHLEIAAGHTSLPYLDFETSGGHPGCGNEDYGFDVCVGNYPRPTPGDGGRFTIAVTHIVFDSNHHITDESIEVPPASYPLTGAQRIWVMCHEVGHVLGLAHNTANPASCEQATMPGVVGQASPAPPQTLGSDDLQELVKFYDGHAE